MKNVAFINHSQKQCGVQQYGKRLGNITAGSELFHAEYFEIDDINRYYSEIGPRQWDAIIFNWHPSTMNWLTPEVASLTNGKNVFVHHEGGQPTHLYPSAILMVDGTTDGTYGLTRPLPKYTGTKRDFHKVPTIGSFGFGFDNKGFERVVQKVCAEFDEAVVNLHITSAFFGDREGHTMYAISDRCIAASTKPGVTVNVTNHFMSDQEVMDFLASNTMNLFLYDDMPGRGLASTIDYAVAAECIFGVSDTYMFRHVLPLFPILNADRFSLRDIIEIGNSPARMLKGMWADMVIHSQINRVLEAL